MTPQEIFDKAVGGIIAQDKLSQDDKGKCFYRSADGSACVVGQLIDDETAHCWDNQGEWGASSIDKIIICGILPPNLKGHEQLLIDLQIAHDDVNGTDPRAIELFITNARLVSEKHHLEWKF